MEAYRTKECGNWNLNKKTKKTRLQNFVQEIKN